MLAALGRRSGANEAEARRTTECDGVSGPRAGEEGKVVDLMDPKVSTSAARVFQDSNGDETNLSSTERGKGGARAFDDEESRAGSSGGFGVPPSGARHAPIDPRNKLPANTSTRSSGHARREAFVSSRGAGGERDDDEERVGGLRRPRFRSGRCRPVGLYFLLESSGLAF